MEKTCPKCHRVITPQDPSPHECPRCGVVYDKYYQHLAAQKNRETPQNDTDGLHDQILDEIHKRVLDKERKQQKEQEWESRAQATVDALEEVTDVPREQIAKIAKDVRQEYVQEEPAESVYATVNQQANQWLKRGVLMLVAGVVLLWLLNAGWTAWRYSRISTEITTTTAVSDYQPVDSIKEFAVTARKMYTFIRFQHIPKGSHTLKVQIIDARDKVMVACDGPTYIRSESISYWCPFTPNSMDAAAGEWTFEVYLDKKRLATVSRTVLPEPEPALNAAPGKK